jgi:hypothetical protein
MPYADRQKGLEYWRNYSASLSPEQLIAKRARNRAYSALRRAAGTHNPYPAGHAYWSWHSMKLRCYYEIHDSYPRYGGRGITVCERWLESFENFKADMGPRPSGKTLNRIDNDGNYEPNNCNWATPKEQRHNQGVA